MDWEKLMCPDRVRTSSTGTHFDRSQYQRDYDRIIFSKPFRRLHKKTQVFPLPEHDFIHTRLTHSLETSCVGRSLGMAAGKVILDKNPDLKSSGITPYDFAAVVSAAAVAHDIGNPPFGHSGEDAISDFFASEEGNLLIKDLAKPQQLDLLNFEGNAMGFRLMAYTLPGVSSNEGGLNLTYATLGAFVKYPCEVTSDKLPGASGKKYGFFQSQKDFFIKVADKLGMKRKDNSCGITAFYRHPLAFLVEAADDISYLLMDLEDGYSLKLVTEKEAEDALRELLIGDFSNSTFSRIHDQREKVAYLRAIAISSLTEQVNAVFMEKLPEIMEGKYDTALDKQIEKAAQLKNLETLCREKVYIYRKVLEIESAGFEVIGGLLREFLHSLKDDSNKAKKVKSLLSKNYIVEQCDTSDQWYEAVLHVVQFVAGMTDTFAIDTYRTIKGIRLPNY
jgi:dGTPase